MDPRLYNALCLYVPLAFLAGVTFAYFDRRRALFRRNGVHVFKPLSVIRLFYIWAVSFGVGLMVGPSWYLHSPELWSICSGALVLSIAILTWPPSLYVDWEGLTARRWWGGATQIRWDDVSELRYDYHGFRTIVTSTTGKRIEHTLIDCDPDGFQCEIVTRSDHRLAEL